MKMPETFSTQSALGSYNLTHDAIGIIELVTTR